MSDSRTRRSPHSSKACRTRTRRVRWWCIQLLDHVADERAIAAISPLLDDPVPRVRRNAAHALGCVACKPEWNGTLDAATVAKLEHLAASDENARVRRDARASRWLPHWVGARRRRDAPNRSVAGDGRAGAPHRSAGLRPPLDLRPPVVAAVPRADLVRRDPVAHGHRGRDRPHPPRPARDVAELPPSGDARQGRDDARPRVGRAPDPRRRRGRARLRLHRARRRAAHSRAARVPARRVRRRSRPVVAGAGRVTHRRALHGARSPHDPGLRAAAASAVRDRGGRRQDVAHRRPHRRRVGHVRPGRSRRDSGGHRAHLAVAVRRARAGVRGDRSRCRARSITST